MAANLNKTMIMGRLGRDPEVRTTGGGKVVANISVAVSEKWKDKDGEWKEKTEWFTVVLWGKQAEIAQRFLKKGSSVYVEGKMQTRSWDDPNGAGKRYATELICDNFQMLDKPQGSPAGPEEAGGSFGGSMPEIPGGVAPGDDDMLPF